MKKLLFISLAILSANAMAWEFNAKGGYDFLRAENIKTETEKNSVGLENGWVVGAEFIPLNKNKFEFGVGAEYNFGKNTRFFDGEDQIKRKYVPVYALTKFNLITSEDNTASLYLLGRLGGAYRISEETKTTEEVTETGKKTVTETTKKGELNPYYGLGLGFDYKNFLVEALYDGSYRKVEDPKAKAFVNKLGLRVGFRFGDYKKAAPVVVEEPAFLPIPEVVEAPAVVAPVVVESKGRLIHASCSEVEKKCIIHGFKVDGREPNAEEKANIAEIAQLVNGFAISGEARLVGHTDSTGSDAYNQKLSVARAQSVNKLLRESGLKEEVHIHEVTGKGEKEPMATNKTREGRYLNRRVEILFDELNVR